MGDGGKHYTVYKYQLVDYPGQWLTLITHQPNDFEALRSLRAHFGKRLVKMQRKNGNDRK